MDKLIIRLLLSVCTMYIDGSFKFWARMNFILFKYLYMIFSLAKNCWLKQYHYLLYGLFY